MITYTPHELETLEKWLQQKISSIPTNPANSAEQYGEVNLSKSVLKFIKYLVQQELQKTIQQNIDSLYTYGYNIGPSQQVYNAHTIQPSASSGITINNTIDNPPKINTDTESE